MKHVVDPGIEEFIYNIYTFTGEVIRKRKFRRLAVFRSFLAVLFFGPGSFFSGIRTNDGVQRVGSRRPHRHFVGWRWPFVYLGGGRE